MTRQPMIHSFVTATRSLLRSPMVAASAILCMSVGIAASTSVSSAVSRVLLAPLPFRDADRLMTLYGTTPQVSTAMVSAANFVDLRAGVHRLGALAAVASGGGLLSTGESSAQVSARRVTSNLFSLLGTRPVLGRLFVPEDGAPGAEHVAVLGEELWHDEFGSDPSVIGRAVQLGERRLTVIGIAPANFGIPRGRQVVRSDMWTLLQLDASALQNRRRKSLMVVGRLAPGVELASAAAEVDALFANIVRSDASIRDERIRVVSLREDANGAVRKPLLLMFAAVCTVLLIAAINVASLLLARGVRRRREFAVRAALGGTRLDIVRPVIIEGLVILIASLAIGLSAGWLIVHTLGAQAAAIMPQLEGASLDARTVLLAIGLGIAVSTICAGLPAWRMAGVDPQEALRSGRGAGMSGRDRRLLNTLIVFEVALSFVLLIGAGLSLRGFMRLSSNDPGFTPEPLLTMSAVISPAWYPDGNAVGRFLEPVLDRIRQVPQVESAASISSIPYDDWGNNTTIRYHDARSSDELPTVETRTVTPGFFDVTRQRLLAGRVLQPSDDERHQPVAVVNEALARRDFGGTSPMGQEFRLGDSAPVTVVGVVSDIRNFGPFDNPWPEVYQTYRQRTDDGTSTFPIIVRMRPGVDATAAAAAVRSAIREVQPRAAVAHMQRMTDVIARSIGRPHFYLTLLAAFACVALLLATAGIYGVLSYVVAQRTHELGVRSALGGTPAIILWLVLRSASVPIVCGIAAGLLCALLLSRIMAQLLYGVSPLDLTTWLTVGVGLLTCGLAASLLPAFRATRASPLSALRDE